MGLGLLWLVEGSYTAIALSSNGQVLLTQSTKPGALGPLLELHSTVTGDITGPGWSESGWSGPGWGVQLSNNRPSGFSVRGPWSYSSFRQVIIHAMGLDHTGHTAVVAFAVSSGNSSSSDTTIRAWDIDLEGASKYVLFERTIKNVESVDVLSVSRTGNHFAIAYTSRPSGAQSIEIIRIRGEEPGPRFFTLGGWKGRQTLRPGSSICFSHLDGFVTIAVQRPEEIYLIRFESPKIVMPPDTESTKVTIEGQTFVLVDIYQGQQFAGLSKTNSSLKAESFEYSPASKEFALATSKELSVWNTITKRGFHRRLQLSTVTGKSETVCTSYSSSGDQFALSSSGRLELMDASYFHCFQGVDLPPLGKSHVLCFCERSIHIISTTDAGFITCYKLPYSLTAEATEEGAPLDLSEKISLTNDHIGGGGFGDVFKATWKFSSVVEPPEVAVKVIRVLNINETPGLQKRHAREIEVWKRVKHANIVPLLGLIWKGPIPSLVSQWMPNGTVKDFLARHPDYDRLTIIGGVANGLDFLHSREPTIIHGDMKAANVLVDAVGSPRIIDFGISRLIDPSTLWNTTKSTADGSMRWMSPELLMGDDPLPTAASDVYALAMTIIEILTGEVPFARVYPRNEQVMFNVAGRNTRPERPACEECTDSLWDVLKICWNSHPQHRWSMSRVNKEFKDISSCINPLRILAIDHSYSRMSAIFAYLRKLESELELGANIGSQFDLICGSSFGGFIALLLGILELNVDECYAEYWALCLVFRDIAKKRGAPNNLFAWEHLYDSSIESHLEDLIIRYGLDPKACLSDFQFTRPRVLLIANTWRRVPSQRRSYRTPSDLPWDTITLHAAFMHSLALPGGHVCINPAELALQEAREIFGRYRDIGYLISCGMGHTVSGSPWAQNGAGPTVENPRVRSRLKYIRATEITLHETHLKLTRELGDAYFRFDMKEYIEISGTVEFMKTWGSVLDAQDWRVLQSLNDLSKRYMASPAQVEKVAKCAMRMRAKRIARADFPTIPSIDDETMEDTSNLTSQGTPPAASSRSSGRTG